MTPADRATVPVARLALTGLPVTCPHCATVAAEWPLIVHGLVIKAACPACWTAVLPVVAVPGNSPHDPAAVYCHTCDREHRIEDPRCPINT